MIFTKKILSTCSPRLRLLCRLGQARQLCAMSLSIGVDVGETNTNAVILKEKDVLCSAKAPSTEDVTSGIIETVQSVLKQLPEELARSPGAHVERVSIGTTQFVNAVKQGKDLARVALYRLCYPATIAIPPNVPGFHNFFYLKGGYEFNGTVINEVDEKEVKEITEKVYDEGTTNVLFRNYNTIWARRCTIT